MSSSQPNTPKLYSVSHSKLAEFRRCLQRYHWKYVDKYYPPSGIGQVRGTAGHAALAVWHKEYNAQQAMDAAWEAWENHNLPQNNDWDILETCLNRYFVWSREHDTFKLLVAEQRFDIEFPASDTPGENTEPFVLTGYIDGIVEEGGVGWLLESKFYKRMDSNPLDLDPQVSIYMLASYMLDYHAKYKIQGVIYNMLRVADTKIAATEPVVRRRVHRNPTGLYRLQHEVMRQAQAMKNYDKGGGVPYRNPTKDCSWDCPFYQPCLSMMDDSQEPTSLLESIAQTRSKQDAKEQATEHKW